jgi:NAD(P)-dependent dehydrogenase (short-subunit alcohol dehydrogenase family)
MSGKLAGKVAIVTGAGSGIGLAITEEFHREGALVVAVDISGRQEDVSKQLGEGCLPLHADVTTADGTKAMVDSAASTFGRLDILVNNAGTDGNAHPVGECPEEEWDRVLGLNLKGAFLGMRYAIPEMAASGGGAVVNMASMAALVAFPQRAPYGASKAGLLMLTKVAAAEYAAAGVRANAICPGVIDTPLNAGLPAELIAGVKAATPLGRIADPAEVARVAVFLAGDDSSFMTGAVVSVDGGYTIL